MGNVPAVVASKRQKLSSGLGARRSLELNEYDIDDLANAGAIGVVEMGVILSIGHPSVIRRLISEAKSENYARGIFMTFVFGCEKSALHPIIVGFTTQLFNRREVEVPTYKSAMSLVRFLPVRRKFYYEVAEFLFSSVFLKLIYNYKKSETGMANIRAARNIIDVDSEDEVEVVKVTAPHAKAAEANAAEAKETEDPEPSSDEE